MTCPLDWRPSRGALAERSRTSSDLASGRDLLSPWPCVCYLLLNASSDDPRRARVHDLDPPAGRARRGRRAAGRVAGGSPDIVPRRAVLHRARSSPEDSSFRHSSAPSCSSCVPKALAARRAGSCSRLSCSSRRPIARRLLRRSRTPGRRASRRPAVGRELPVRPRRCVDRRVIRLRAPAHLPNEVGRLAESWSGLVALAVPPIVGGIAHVPGMHHPLDTSPACS